MNLMMMQQELDDMKKRLKEMEDDGFNGEDDDLLSSIPHGIPHGIYMAPTWQPNTASYKDSMISCLRSYLERKKCLVFGGEFFHCRCACHITNLVVQARLKLIDNVVVKIRSIIKHFRYSIPKKRRFYSVAETKFGIKTNKKLRGDNCIRWNSTFLMLDLFLYFRNVIDHVVSRDKYIKIFALSINEWDRVVELHSFLKLFYVVTNAFSASKNPTANLYFDGV
ncbi:hypothetical protein OSB04_029096 [Centaurea solstitialis]|uniref:Uncharacterized protein n=1 Tax=Centaurea solstitialis TaxID=347529 RepID=A0AA38SUH9_9ASTR|nr:hypothetical protein OSB04_029096 [Centaurea solstitialis]